MEKRTLTITLNPDWRAALRAVGRKAKEPTYQGELLNFETPGTFVSRLTERRWLLIEKLLGAGEMSVRELARRSGYDVKGVHADVVALEELGLVERTAERGVVCPYESIHLDMHLGARGSVAA